MTKSLTPNSPLSRVNVFMCNVTSLFPNACRHLTFLLYSLKNIYFESFSYSENKVDLFTFALLGLRPTICYGIRLVLSLRGKLFRPRRNTELHNEYVKLFNYFIHRRKRLSLFAP